MSEWWTYELSDFLLFAPRTYYRLIELYNAEIWPGQFVALLAGLAVLALLRGRAAWQGRAALALLAAGWLWVAWAFHYTRYATINWAAVYFALAFAVQGAAMLALAVARAGRPPGPPGGLAGAMGMALAAFAVLLHPLLGPLAGRTWSQAELFALAPDPTVAATLGALVLARGWPRWALLPVPLLWCALSGAIAWAMQAPDALVMPLAAALALVGLAASRGCDGGQRPRPAAP